MRARAKIAVRLISFGILVLGAGLYFDIPWLSLPGRGQMLPVFTGKSGERYEFRNATHHRLAVEWLDAPNDPGPGGAMVPWENGLLIMTRLGRFHVWRPGMKAFRKIDVSQPFHVAEEVAIFTRPLDISSFGGHGLALRASGDGYDLFAVHTRAHPDRNCVALAVSLTRLVPSADGLLAQASEWRTVYETQPCLPLEEKPLLLQIGGAATFAPDGGLLVEVGDFGFDGVGRSPKILHPQDSQSDYGKLLEIDPQSGERHIISLGHRNSGGVTVDDDGRIWMVEHGPRGGDELNLIRPGANYGWPLVTLGAEYTSFDWPPNPRNGRHEGFEMPVFSWLPSLAVSSVVQVSGDALPAWRGDLVVGTLAGMRLVHLRMAEGPRVVFAEEIDIEARIRAIAVLASGKLALKLDAFPNVLLLSADASVEAAEEALPDALLACAGCHAFRRGSPALAGPSLAGIWGREVGSEPGYAYSDALSSAGGRWTRERLAAFLGEPRGFGEGSTMPPQALEGADLDAVLAALESRGGAQGAD